MLLLPAVHIPLDPNIFPLCLQLEEPERAEEQLTAAAELHAKKADPQRTKLMDMARIMLSSI